MEKELGIRSEETRQVRRQTDLNNFSKSTSRDLIIRGWGDGSVGKVPACTGRGTWVRIPRIHGESLAWQHAPVIPDLWRQRQWILGPQGSVRDPAFHRKKGATEEDNVDLSPPSWTLTPPTHKPLSSNYEKAKKNWKKVKSYSLHREPTYAINRFGGAEILKEVRWVYKVLKEEEKIPCQLGISYPEN